MHFYKSVLILWNLQSEAVRNRGSVHSNGAKCTVRPDMIREERPRIVIYIDAVVSPAELPPSEGTDVG